MPLVTCLCTTSSASEVMTKQHYTNQLLLVFNCLNNLAPSYLSTMCQPVADITLAVVTCARLRVVILLFQPPEQSTTVLALRCCKTVHVELSSSTAR